MPSVSEQRPPSSLIARHIEKSPMVKIMLGGRRYFYPPRMLSSNLLAVIRSFCASDHNQIRRALHLLVGGHVHRLSSVVIVLSLHGLAQSYGLGRSEYLSMEAYSNPRQSPLPFIIQHVASGRSTWDSPRFLSVVLIVFRVGVHR